MKIYTKTGDKGLTSGLDNKPVSKSDQRLITIGTIDELNSTLGLVSSVVSDASITRKLDLVQNDLFGIGSYLSSSDDGFILNLDVTKLENQIDEWTDVLPSLRNFILPGGTIVSAQVHFARAVARRAEREIVTLHEKQQVDPKVLQYVNRLSDWLFTLARFVNFQEGAVEKIWKKG